MSGITQGLLISFNPAVAWSFSNPPVLLAAYSYTGNFFSFTAPSGGILVDAYGAQGGIGCNNGTPYNGANGGRIQAYFQLDQGTTIYGIVGQQGLPGSGRAAGGGGGFTALWTGGADPGLGTWLIGAGGGGGSGGEGYSQTIIATGGGTSTVTQGTSISGGAGGAGGNGGQAGTSGSASGGGTGGGAPGDMSGGGGGGGYGSTGGAITAAGNGTPGPGGYGGGGGAGNGGAGGYEYRTGGGGGGGGGYNGGAGGEKAGTGGAGGTNFYKGQTFTGSGPTQLVLSSQGVRSGNGYIEIYV